MEILFPPRNLKNYYVIATFKSYSKIDLEERANHLAFNGKNCLNLNI